jgi:hypothetical protein
MSSTTEPPKPASVAKSVILSQKYVGRESIMSHTTKYTSEELELMEIEK